MSKTDNELSKVADDLAELLDKVEHQRNELIFDMNEIERKMVPLKDRDRRLLNLSLSLTASISQLRIAV